MKRSILFIFVCIALFLCGCTKRVGRNVTVAGTDVSRMTAEEAVSAVSAREAEKIGCYYVTLTHGEKTLCIPASSLGTKALADEAVRRALLVRARDDKRAIAVEWETDALKTQAAAASAAEHFYRAPKDASAETDFSRDEPFFYQPEQAGEAVDEKALVRLLSEAAARRSVERLSVPICAVPAQVTAEALKLERQMIACFSTSFASAPYNAENRVHNIVKAAERINGRMLRPGETFDCNAVLGDRNAENGWREAPGIRNGTYVSEYGGGVCQLSSTLFNAVLAANLTVTERHPHSWPMGYVDIGRDAAISTGGKNFQFVNDSVSPVYLKAEADRDAGRLTVCIYGSALENGETLAVSSEQTGLLAEPQTVTALDETLPVNTSIISREARRGKTSRTMLQRYAADGTLLSTEVLYEDAYRSIDGLTYVSADIYYS